MIQVGETFPLSLCLHENEMENKVDVALSGKKVVVIGIPSPFTPTCADQMEEYLEHAEQIKAKDVEGIGGKKRNGVRVGGGKIRMMGDPLGEFTRALGMEIDSTDYLGGTRCRRFAMVLNNGNVETLLVEDNQDVLAPAEKTTATELLKQL